ncbi:hypothetical protein GCM10009422_21650 [Brevundimonas kwangchunensis]|uniref:Pyrrolo-quinoline quinone repeat domain-containing protein n=1 Tax=Brevundimonas kwangchunensis TaxID=322163 RepID=A0ABN1GZT7_9CAUL
MNRVLKVALLCGLAVTVASCGSVRRALPFGLGGSDEPRATATAGERISVLEFDQQLAPSAALSGRDFFVPGPQAATAWTQPGGNAENAIEHVIGAQEFTVAWRRNIGAGSARDRQVMAPVVADSGQVFAMDGESSVSALDASSGAQAWRTNVRPEGRERGGFGGGIAVGGGKVFVASGYRTISALDQATGQVLWTTPVDVPVHGAPTVSGSRVFVVDVENQIVALDVNTGRQEWSYRGIPEPARIMRAASPAVTGDTVIVPFSSGEVVALRASTGQALWNQVLSRTSRTSALSELRDIAGRPVVSRGFVYAVGHSGVMAAMDARSGQPRWQLPVAGVNAPLPVGDVVYVVSKSGELSVINRESGQVYWTRNLNEGRIRQEGGFLGFWDRTVTPEWSGPLLASNRLLLVNSDGDLVAFDPKTGAQTASLKLGAGSFIAPAAYNGSVFVLTDKGDLVSIR